MALRLDDIVAPELGGRAIHVEQHHAVAVRVRRELGLETTTRDHMRPVTVSSKPDSLVLEIT